MLHRRGKSSLVFLSYQIYKVKALVKKPVAELEFHFDLVPSVGWQLFTKAWGDRGEKSHPGERGLEWEQVSLPLMER